MNSLERWERSVQLRAEIRQAGARGAEWGASLEQVVGAHREAQRLRAELAELEDQRARADERFSRTGQVQD